MKNFKTIEFEINNGVGTIWLNRPEVHNAFNDIMLNEIIETVEQVNKRLEELGAEIMPDNQGIIENVSFVLPKELRLHQ